MFFHYSDVELRCNYIVIIIFVVAYDMRKEICMDLNRMTTSDIHRVLCNR